jgi:hypothetical protein
MKMNTQDKIALGSLAALGIVWLLSKRQPEIIGDTHRLMGLGVQGHSGMNMIH